MTSRTRGESVEDRTLPRQRPAQRAQGSQRWHGLLFSHWEVPAQLLRPLVPSSLTLDAYEQRYYIGVVAFSMQRVRPYWYLPPFPTAREFGEINVRTYVHLDGKEPGVYFFSLDAASSLAVWAARNFWSLPYFKADITAHYNKTTAHYACRRHKPQLTFSAQTSFSHSALPEPQPSSLPFFLCERYQFYTQDKHGLWRARVHHRPYELFEAQAHVDTTLIEAAGLPTHGARTPDYYSPGVDVEVFPLTRV